MADWQGYMYIEVLSMTAQQRQTLVDALRAWGVRNDSQYPHERNHWRVRPDGLAVIFEAVFDNSLMTAVAMRNRLAQLFGVAQASVTYATTQTAYGPVVTFTYNAIARLRMGVFGGVDATYADSWAAAQAFLQANAAAWGDTQDV
jgi:hypothetical protein